MPIVCDPDKKPAYDEISPEIIRILDKLRRNIPLDPGDYDLWLSPQEVAEVLSWKKSKDTGQKSRVSVKYLGQLIRSGRLEHGPRAGSSYRYRLSQVLHVEFHPRGPRPKSASESGRRQVDGS